MGLFGSGCAKKDTSLLDDAGGRKPQDFPEIAADIFQPMDGGIKLAPDELRAGTRGTSGAGATSSSGIGVAREELGFLTCSKMIDSRNHDRRFKDLGP